MFSFPSPVVVVVVVVVSRGSDGFLPRAQVVLECAKYGEVLHVHVDAHSPRGLVHVLFTDPAHANLAAKSLHGRWFAGRLINVSFLDERAYRAQ